MKNLVLSVFFLFSLSLLCAQETPTTKLVGIDLIGFNYFLLGDGLITSGPNSGFNFTLAKNKNRKFSIANPHYWRFGLHYSPYGHGRSTFAVSNQLVASGGFGLEVVDKVVVFFNVAASFDLASGNNSLLGFTRVDFELLDHDYFFVSAYGQFGSSVGGFSGSSNRNAFIWGSGISLNFKL